MEAPSELRAGSPSKLYVGTPGDNAAPLQDSVERIEQLRPNLGSKPAASGQLNVHAINAPVAGSGVTSPSFWIALLAGEFKEGETFYIEYSGEKNIVPCILPVQYRLSNLTREQDYFEVYLEHPVTQTKLYCLRGDFQNGTICEIQVKRDEDNTITVPADLFERSYLASKEKTNSAIEFPSTVSPKTPSYLGNTVIRKASASPKQSLLGFRSTFETLRRHLLSIASPYTARYLYERIKDFYENYFDSNAEKEMGTMFDGPAVPLETRELIKQLISKIIEQLKAASDNTNRLGTLNEIMKDLREFNEKWHETTQTLLRSYAGWKEFETLFKLPSFLSLSQLHYIELKNLIDLQDTDGLRGFLDRLETAGLFKKKQASEELKGLGYRHNLNTLLGEVIAKRPLKKGITVIWLEPEDFFKNKSLQLIDHSQEDYSGTILRCERTSTGLVLHMQDQSKVHISESFQVSHIKIHRTSRLLNAILNGSYRHGDEFTVVQSSRTSTREILKPGIYRLLEPRIFKNSSVLGVRDHYFECSFGDLSQEGGRYVIRGEFDKTGAISSVKIVRGNSLNSILVNVQIFEQSCNAIRKEATTLTSINRNNADERVLIKEESEESKTKSQLELIQNQLNQARSALLIENDGTLLDELMEDLVVNHLERVNFELFAINHPEFSKIIISISRNYYDKLKIDRLPASILHELVLEANYARYVEKQDTISAAKTMELLKDAYTHIEKMHGKEITLFLGNTGSGKSTAVGFLMGAELVEFLNGAGEKALRLVENAPKNTYPVIGQSIGNSETLYVQGFPVDPVHGNDPLYMLCDCPGFGDTRKDGYEICSSLSLDQAIKQSKNIRSLVVVVPASAFLVDRGNNIIELIETIRERFPDSFSIDMSQTNPRTYLLVTKVYQLQSNIINKLKDGERFREFERETDTQIRTLVESKVEFESFEVQTLRRRLQIWKALGHMSKSRIHFLDTQNQVQQEELLKEYAAPNLSSKGNYQKAMSSSYLQRQFRDYMQTSTHTWSFNILGQYLKAVPDKIDSSKRELDKKNARIEELEADKKRRAQKVPILAAEIQQLEEILQLLRQHSLDNPQIRKMLLTKASTHKNEKLEQERASLGQCRELLASKQQLLKETGDEIAAITSTINSFERQIKDRETRIEELQEGFSSIPIFESKFKPEDKLNLKTWASDTARKSAYTRLQRHDSDHALDEIISVKAGQHEGTVYQLVMLEQDYQLVPSDPALRRQFIKSGQGGKYAANVTGERYEIDLRCNAEPQGKKIAYGFRLKFKPGEPLPWIKIEHIIPRSERNASRITNFTSEIVTLTRAAVEAWNSLQELNKRKSTLEEEIAIKLSEISLIEKKIQGIEDELAREYIPTSLVEIEQQIASITKEIAHLEDLSELSKKIQKALDERNAEVDLLKLLDKDLRNIGIIIVAQWQSARVLRQFAHFVLESYSKPGSQNTSITSDAFPDDREGLLLKKSIQTSCQEFIDLFDHHKDTLLDKIKNQHKF